MRWGIVIGIGALVLLLALGAIGTTLAQGEPGAGGVGRYLPPAETLGPGWLVVHADDPQPSPGLFREGAKVAYGGPAGARAVVFAWVLADERSLPQAWAAAGDLMGRYQAAFAPEAAATDPRLPEAAPPGCAAATRAEGVDPASEFPAGLTLCAVGSEAIILAVVSGDLGPARGAAAADRLVGVALAAAGSGATPPAATPATPVP